MELQTCNLSTFDTLTCTSIILLYVHVHLWVCYVSLVGLPTLLCEFQSLCFIRFCGINFWWDVWFWTSWGFIDLFRVRDSGWGSSRPCVWPLTNGLGSSLFNFVCTVMTLGRVYLLWVNRHRRNTMNAIFRNRQVHLSVPLKHSLRIWLKSDVFSRNFSGILCNHWWNSTPNFSSHGGVFTHRTD